MGIWRVLRNVPGAGARLAKYATERGRRKLDYGTDECRRLAYESGTERVISG